METEKNGWNWDVFGMERVEFIELIGRLETDEGQGGIKDDT